MLYNEFDRTEKFYKRLKAECQLRIMAETFTNSYVIAIFACCRQLYDPTWMKGVCLSKDEANSLDSKLSVTIKEILSVEKKPTDIEDNLEKSVS